MIRYNAGWLTHGALRLRADRSYGNETRDFVECILPLASLP
jgi:hypothetical protein